MNILLDGTTGDTVHVDFNCLFDKVCLTMRILVSPCYAHPVDDVVREAEGNPLGNFKGPTLRSV
jgi:hypothetical protein